MLSDSVNASPLRFFVSILFPSTTIFIIFSICSFFFCFSFPTSTPSSSHQPGSQISSIPLANFHFLEEGKEKEKEHSTIQDLGRHSSMAEEHRCQAPEGHRLCANNCGFFGSPATMNLCSKCYRDIRLKEQEEASTKSTIETVLSSSSSASASSTPPSSTPSPSPSPSPLPPAVESLPPPLSSSIVTVTVSAAAASGPVSSPIQPNRCAACRKRVGLTGFNCRCGVTFCGTHRYPEKHACSFDFKTVGREEIARANPLIKAEKLERI